MNDAFDQTNYDLKPTNQNAETVSAAQVDRSCLPLDGIDWSSSFGGRFDLIGQLGCGGFAVVYRVFDRKLQREVALKVLRASAESDVESRKWLKREGLATASLKHPHIVTLYDFEATDNCCYLVSELIVGTTLARFIQEHPSGCEPRMAAEIVMLLAEALAHAHSKNILHRDIKPSNILLDSALPTGSLPFSPRLADFGLATSPSLESLSQSASNLMGTVYYLPPEIVNGQPCGFTAQGDIYALALVLRELLTGRRVVTGTTYSQIISQISTVDFEQLCPRQSDIPADLLAVCFQGTELNPNKRYATATAFANDLRNFMEGKSVAARLPNFRERSWRLIKRYPAIFFSVSLLLLTLTSIATMALIADARLSKVNKELEGQNQQLEAALADSRAARYHNEQIIYAQDMSQASNRLEDGDLRGVRSILDRYSSSQPLHGHSDQDYQMLTKDIQGYTSELLWTAPHALYSGCFTRDGQKLYLGGASSQITEIDPMDASWNRQLDTHQIEVNSTLLVLDQTVLCSTGDDGTITAHKIEDYSNLWRTQVFEAPTEAHDLIYLDKLDRLVVLSSSEEIRSLSANDGKLLSDVPAPKVKKSALANLKDGQHFLFGDARSSIYKVDGETMQVVAELGIGSEKHRRVATEPFRSITVSSDGKWATAITRNNIVYLVDLINWSITDSTSSPEQPRIICFLDSPFDSTRDTSQRLWLITRPGVMVELYITADGKLQPLDSWVSDGRRYFAALQNPQTQNVITLDADGGVRAWSKPKTEWNIVSQFTQKQTYSFLIIELTRGIDPRGQQTLQELFLFNGQKGIEIWNRNHPEILLNHELPTAALCQVGPDQLWAIKEPGIARTISCQKLLDIVQSAVEKNRTGDTELPWQERALPFRADEFQDASRKYRLVAADSGMWIAGWDAEAQRVWCMHRERPKINKTSPSQEVTLVWFEPQSHNCWWVSRHLEIYRWNLDSVENPQLVTKLNNQTAKDLALSPDKNLLAIQLDDSSCKLWDLKRKQWHSELLHSETILDIAFSASGRTLMVLGGQGRLTCWNIASGRITYDQAYKVENILGGFSRDASRLIRSTSGRGGDGQNHLQGWKIESLE